MQRTFLYSILTVIVLTGCKNENNEEVKAEVAEANMSSMNPIYIGTYTKKEGHVDGQAEGIYVVYQNPETGDLKMGKTVAKVTNPSFLKTSKDNRNLYAVSELGPNDGPSGLLYSYKINLGQGLEELGSVSTEGFAPCYIAEDQSGKFVFVANYVGGVVVMYEKDADGSLKKLQKITLENPDKSHPHSVNISADNKFVYIPDLGNDRIWIFKLNTETKSLKPHENPFIQLAEGAGPRHFAFSKNSDFAYSINELNGSISAFQIGDKGELTHIENISSLPESFKGKNSAADLHLHPSGKYLYASNRGHNSIAAFVINNETGKLKNIGYTETQGSTPRNFAISPDGEFLYVANQDSNNLIGFKINTETGALEYIAATLEVKTPVGLEFLD